MADTTWIHEFLREARVPYTVVPHGLAFTAREDAEAVHVPGDNWAKVVTCMVDGEPIQAVLPATSVIDLPSLLDLLGGLDIRLADEDELRRLYPDCELGAMPPFGPAYGQPVFVDVALAQSSEIIFNAGTHTDAISMRWTDFAAAVRPIVGRFARPTIDGIEVCGF